MIQLEVFPSFHPKCSFQVWEQEGVSWFGFLQPPQFDFAEIRLESEIDPQSLEKLLLLAKQVIDTPTPDDRLILDGVSLTCGLLEDGNDLRQRDFRCPQNGTPEFALTDAFFQLSQELIHDARFICSIETLEGYFYNKLPVKIFDENPRRIRFYGAMTSDNLDRLTDLILRNSNRDALIVDITNCEGMAIMLYGCFTPLLQIKDLKFLANGTAQYQLLAMGFAPEQIELSGPPLPENTKRDAAIAALSKHDFEGATIIKRLLRTWFLKYGNWKESDVNGSEQFTLFDKLSSEWKEKYINQLDLHPAEWPVYILRINAEDFIINTTHRFIHFANGQFDELDYRNFNGPRGFKAMFTMSNEEYEKASPKQDGHFAEFLLDTKDGKSIAWMIPTGKPGYAFWNITRNCRIIGEKYLRGGSRSSAFFEQ